MSFHISELQSIKNSLQGWFKGSLKSEISVRIRTFEPYINEIKNASEQDRIELLDKYLKIATSLRHSALAMGANGPKDPNWAAAAVVESWVCLYRDGTSQEIAHGERIINEMR